jgi:hypothetical protein
MAGIFQEWCDKQMEFVLEHGKPERTQAMKAGSDRHAQLEHEVILLLPSGMLYPVTRVLCAIMCPITDC